MPKYAYAKQSNLPCDQTAEQALQYQEEYNNIKDKVSIKTLIKSIEPFFEQHHKHTAKVYSLAAQGSHAEFFLAKNQQIHLKHSQSIKDLSNLSDYLFLRTKSLNQLEKNLIASLDHQLKTMMQNIQQTIDSIQKDYSQSIKAEFNRLRDHTSKQLSIIRDNLDRLQTEFDSEVLIKRKLKMEQLINITGLTKEQVTGYDTLFKIVSSDTLKGLQAKNKNPQQNEDQELYIESQKLKKATCHDLWCLMELIQTKKNPSLDHSFFPQAEQNQDIDLIKFQTKVDQERLLSLFNDQALKTEIAIIEELQKNILKQSKNKNDGSLSFSMTQGSFMETNKILSDFINKKPLKKLMKSIESRIQSEFKNNRDQSYQIFLSERQKLKSRQQSETNYEKNGDSQAQNDSNLQIFRNNSNEGIIEDPLTPQLEQFENDEFSEFHLQSEESKEIIEYFHQFIRRQSEQEAKQDASEEKQQNIRTLDQYQRPTNLIEIGQEKNFKKTQSNFSPQREQYQSQKTIKVFKSEQSSPKPVFGDRSDPAYLKDTQLWRKFHRNEEQTPKYSLNGKRPMMQREKEQKDQYVIVSEQQRQQKYKMFLEIERQNQKKRQRQQNPIMKIFNQAASSPFSRNFDKKVQTPLGNENSEVKRQLMATEEFLVSLTLIESLQNLKYAKKPHQPFQSNIEPISSSNELSVNDFTRILPQEKQENPLEDVRNILQGMTKIQTSFSLANPKYNFEDCNDDELFFDEDQQMSDGKSFTLFRIQNKKSRGKMTIRQIRREAEQLHNTKEAFSIFVRVIQPVLLTFKNRDTKANRPMNKLIVGDSTGIGVLYMNYYCEVKAGRCLKLDFCRVHKYGRSFEINHFGKIEKENVLGGHAIQRIDTTFSLSYIQRSYQNKLKYDVRSYFNPRLSECIKDFTKNRRITIGEMDFNKPIIVTVIQKLDGRKCVIGDYTGMILADFSGLRWHMSINKNDTLIVRKSKLRFNQGMVTLVATALTMVTKADIEFQFYHDVRFIPNIKANEY